MSEKILIIGKNSKISKELLKKIPKNKTVKEFMSLLEAAVENRSKELMAEVGFNE